MLHITVDIPDELHSVPFPCEVCGFEFQVRLEHIYDGSQIACSACGTPGVIATASDMRPLAETLKHPLG